jgi:hypothetical protein
MVSGKNEANTNLNNLFYQVSSLFKVYQSNELTLKKKDLFLQKSLQRANKLLQKIECNVSVVSLRVTST